MSKILAEADTFDANIIVPEGDDDQDNHAEDLEAFVQKLTNRTRYLVNHKARLDGHNEFAETNTFEALVTVHNTVRVEPQSSSMPGLHVERNGQAFQEVGVFRSTSTSGDYVRLYSGNSPTSVGAFYICVNARWTPEAGWSRVINGRDSTAIIVRDADVRVVRRGSGESGTWSAWAQNTITDFNAEVLSEVFRAARMRVIANHAGDYSNGYRYTDPVASLSPIPLGLCWGNVQVNDAGHIRRNSAIGDADAVWFPVPVPPFSTFGTLNVQFYQLQNATPDSFQLYKRTHTGGWVAVGAVESRPVGGAQPTVINLHPGPEQLVLDSEEWAYRWKVTANDLAAIENRIVGISVNWTNYGLHNRIG